MRFVVIDLETTSREPAESHIVEWAAVVIEPMFFGNGGIAETVTGLIKPPIPIPPETSAVHHIIDSDVEHAAPWETAKSGLIDLLEPGTIAVAHNAAYEQAALAKSGLPEVPWLCTYKAALRVWPDAPSHSNEALRYWLSLGNNRGRAAGQSPHSARHDAEVTALLLIELLTKASAEDMLKWTGEPALLPRCPLGDWRGHPWSEVEEGFLLWILRKITDREDVRFCAQHELDRRAEEYRQQQAAKAALAAAAPAEDDEIPF